MSEARTRLYRARRWEEQQHRCFYCQFLTWMDDAEAFAAAHNITLPQARRFNCTAEHLQALGEGGTSRQENIVAACQFCNATRHHRKKRLTPEIYKVRVLRRVSKQSWHPPELHKPLSAAPA